MLKPLRFRVQTVKGYERGPLGLLGECHNTPCIAFGHRITGVRVRPIRFCPRGRTLALPIALQAGLSRPILKNLGFLGFLKNLRNLKS